MDHKASQLERAFQIAASGRCHFIADIRSALSAEGYNTNQVTGRVLMSN